MRIDRPAKISLKVPLFNPVRFNQHVLVMQVFDLSPGVSVKGRGYVSSFRSPELLSVVHQWNSW